MDAQHLEFPPRSFDVVLCSFGLSSLPNVDRVLAECLRVLRSGGRLRITDTFGWYFQHDPRWGWLQDVLRAFGAANGGDSALDDGHVLSGAVARADFTAIESNDDTRALVFRDEQDWWRWAWSHGARSLLEAVPSAGLAACKRDRLRGSTPAAKEMD